MSDDWFQTGDVCKIETDGSVVITDRSKDVIKSGGEWISSIDLENVAVAHPEIVEAAAIGLPHPDWAERPLLVVIAAPGTSPTRESVLAFLDGKIVKWWMPEDVVFVDALPYTATGKVSKKTLRDRFKEYVFPSVAAKTASNGATNGPATNGSV
jgi:fatty-acyl-CoA synthase